MATRRHTRSVALHLVVALLTSVLFVAMPSSPATVVSADDPPPPPPAALSAVSISRSCAVTTVGEVWCWGANWSGNLGNGQRGTNSFDNIHSSVPVRVPGLTGIVEVTRGGGVCARNEAGTVWCWGDNGISNTGFDELSDPPWGTTTPTVVPGLGPAVKISEYCALQTDGTVRCFGWNQWGQLGNGTGGSWNSGGTPDHSVVPVTVSGLTDAVDISGTCAVRATGEVVCWGRNDNSQLGFQHPGGPGDWINAQSLVPVTISGITDAVSVHHGFYGSCAIRQGNKVTCWGTDQGQFFGASSAQFVPPTEVPAFEGAVDFAFFGTNVCAVLSNGTVRCQGRGRLGDGIDFSPSRLVDLPNFSTAVEIEASDSHVCVREVEGAVYCWGSQLRGQLGNGVSHGLWEPYTYALSPVPVSGFVAVPEKRDHLRVTVTADPDRINVPPHGYVGPPLPPEDPPWSVDVTVRIENISDFDVDLVQAEEKLATLLYIGDQKLIVQTGGPVVDPPDVDQTAIGTLPIGDFVELEYSFEIEGNGVYGLNTLVLYKDPITEKPAAARGEAQIRVGMPAAVEGDLHFHGPAAEETITAGGFVPVFLELTNTSNTATVTFDRSALRIRGAGAGGVLVDLEDDPPPLPEPGACPVPRQIVLGPNERLALKTYVYTAPGGGTRAWVDLDVTGTIEDPAEGDRALIASDVSWESDRHELRLSIQDPGFNYGDATWGEVIESFTMGFIEASANWLLSMFGGLWELIKLVFTPITQPFQTMKALQHAVVWAWTVSQMSPLQRNLYYLQTATTVANATGEVVDSVKESFEEHMTEVFEAMYTGDTLRFSRLVGGDLATVALEVGLCEAAVGKLVKAAAETRALVELANLTRAGLNNIRTGATITRRSAYAFGYQLKLVDDLATFAQRNNLNITIKNREPDAIANIAGRQARMKPEFIKPKNVNDVDIDVLGFPAGSKATVALRPNLATEIPDLATLQTRFNAAKAANPGKYSDEMFELAKTRWETRIKELTDDYPGLLAMKDTEVTIPFNTRSNGLDADIGVPKKEKFTMEPLGDGTVELRLDGRPVTSDVDILSITYANGTPLSLEDRVAVYKHLEKIADLQHPESATWVKFGDSGEQIADFAKKLEIFNEYGETVPGALKKVPALQMGADGQLRAVRFVEGGSVFNTTENYYVHWAGGFKAEGTRPLSISGDVSGYSSRNPLTPAEWAAIGATPVVGGAWALGPGAEKTSKQSNDDSAGVYRPDGSDGVEQYQAPPGALSGVVPFSGGAGGQWVPVPEDHFDDVDEILVLPQTVVVEPTEVGDTVLPVFSRRDLAYVGNTRETLLPIDGFFGPGQTIVIDPGGPNEEVATVASANPLTVTAPLALAHEPGEMVVAITPFKHGFADVPSNAFYASALPWLKATGVTTGYGGDDTVFAPNIAVTRGQMAAFLHRLMDSIEIDGALPHTFGDVPGGAFYENALSWLASSGVTTGYGSTAVFAPNIVVTRAQMAAFLWRVAGEPDVAGPHGFDDVPQGAFYEPALAWLKATGITTGYGGSTTTFAPNVPVTRGQMAAFLHRLASTPHAWAPTTILPNTAV